MKRSLAILGIIAACCVPGRALADDEPYAYTAADTRAAMEQHSWLAQCIVEVETGHTLNPYSVGRAGELGVAQLHPRGLLPEFYDAGYTNPFSPYQSMDFLEDALARGEGPAWSAYWYC